MAEQFEGRPITENNLSEWRAGGFEEWLTLQDFLDETRVLSENSGECTARSGLCGRGALTAWRQEPQLADTGISSDHLHIVLLGHHAHLLQNLGIMPEDEYKTRLNTVSKLTASIMKLRRDELQKARLELQRERLEFLREKESLKSPSAPAKTKQPATPAPTSSRPDVRPGAESSGDRISAPLLSTPSLEAGLTVSPGFGRIQTDAPPVVTHSPCHPLSPSRIQSDFPDPSVQTPASRDRSDSVGLLPTHRSLAEPSAKEGPAKLAA